MTHHAGPSYLFVYGTLMRGLQYSNYIAQCGGRFEACASVAGRLYVCAYPALVEAEDERVWGEVYTFADIAAALPVLDEVELEGTMYHRVVVQAQCDDGRVIPAYAYRYAISIRSCTFVPSGDYRQFLAD